MPKSTWSYTDDLRAKPILEFTKQELGDIFGQIPIIHTDAAAAPHGDLSINEIRKEGFVVKEGEDREKYLLKDLVSRIDHNKDIINQDAVLLAYAHTYNNDHCVPPLESKRVDKIIKQAKKYSSGHEETRGRKKKKLTKNTTDSNSKFTLDISHLLYDNRSF